MKKYIAIGVLMFFSLSRSFGQAAHNLITKHKEQLAQAGSDTARIRLLLKVGADYRFSKVDSALFYINKAISLAQKIRSFVGEAQALSDKGSILMDSGDIPHAYVYMLKSLDIIKKSSPDDKPANFIHAAVENRLGNLFMELGEYKTSIAHYRISIQYYNRSSRRPIYNSLSNIGNDFELMGQVDSAQVDQQEAYNHVKLDSTTIFAVFAELQGRLGNVERDLGHYATALNWYRKGANNALKTSDIRNLSELYLSETRVFLTLSQNDSAFVYARKTLEVSRQISMKSSEYQAASLLSELFKESHQADSAFFYLSLSQKTKDELFGPAIFRQLQQLALSEQQRQQQLQEQNDELKYRYTIVGVAGGLIVILLIAFIIWRNYRKQKSTNLLLSEQKEEIASQRDHLGLALDQLKVTQRQLIQSEKMASLGELTAGIAHEIQNPLNFVNNFSEVNTEMLGELEEELRSGNTGGALSLVTELKQNEEKISHHGKRADGIVKGMMEHSRVSSGQKEPTDINALADEYLRLAYHGMQAKDKSFNAELVTHFNKKLPKINAVSQEIGRVMLNLLNNAFYAVSQKAKNAGTGYKPTVEIDTSAAGDQIMISIRDNGNGIPDIIKDKIMQPFFTTKPTGEGTGLGLSLSYDIVVKGHGGTIGIDSVENEFSEFIISLPVK